MRGLLISGLLLALTGSAAGQDRMQIRAHAVETSLTVDGRLDETAWRQAEVATGFRQLEPAQGEPASQPTEVRVLYGPDAVYVGAILFDEEPDEIRSVLSRRDQFNRADWFTVSFDPNDNQETAYTFAVNAAGVEVDGLRTGGDRIDTAIWSSAAARSSEGWIAELRIPYSQLRFPENAGRWRVQFSRRIPRLAEESEWPLVPQSERQNILAQYGVLTGMAGAEAHRAIQFRPYVLSRLTREEDPDRLGRALHSTAADVGGDVKIGLSSNVTLDATVNPDFGQVEADPAQLNLTAFETFFEERRPFFLEGVEIYEFRLEGGSNLLYTRRIGGHAPVLGAAKLSGRTGKGTSFGVLGATTGHRFTPGRTYGVVRGLQQFGEYSSAGGIVTGFEGPASRSGRKRALAGGADWDLRFRNNRYGFEGVAAVTHQAWSDEHFSGRTGFGFSSELAKREGAVTSRLGLTVFDDRFDPNDLGRQRRNNYIELGGNVMYRPNGGEPFGPFQEAWMGIFGGPPGARCDRPWPQKASNSPAPTSCRPRSAPGCAMIFSPTPCR